MLSKRLRTMGVVCACLAMLGIFSMLIGLTAAALGLNGPLEDGYSWKFFIGGALTALWGTLLFALFSAVSVMLDNKP